MIDLENVGMIYKEKEIKDSGNRTVFETGAQRDMQEGKGVFTYGDLETIGTFFSGYCNDETILLLSKGSLQEVFNNLVKKFYDGDIATALMDVAVHYENGAKKYSPHNWKKGIPNESFLNSFIRHYLKAFRGDSDENHKAAAIFNLFGLYYNKKGKQ